ncbi:MAG: 30S ribosomal protein S21 [Chloroflexota bacterium]
MSDVIAGDKENFESLLKRFNRKVQQAGLLAEARRREHYERPGDKRKRKAAAKRRKTSRFGRV